MARQFNIATDFFDYTYIGQPLKIQWNRQNYGLSDDYDTDSIVDRIQFEYKGVDAISFIKSKNCEWYMEVNRLCRIIDIEGKSGYEKYKQILSKLSEIEQKYIIVDNKVFKPNVNKHRLDSRITIYNMNITMTDGVVMDGSNNSIFEKNELDITKRDICSYKKTLKNLSNKVSNYYKEKNIEPMKEFVNEELSASYSSILEWHKTIGINIKTEDD